MSTELVWPTLKLESGLIIPASAGLGLSLQSDSNGQGYWANDNQDALQAGFLGSVNPGLISASIAGGGALTFTNWPYVSSIGDAIRLLNPTSGAPLLRGTAPATPTPTVSGVTSGDYAYVALILQAPSTPGGAISASLGVGTSRSTAALAAADQYGASAFVTGGVSYIVAWDGVVENSGGTYSLVGGTPASGPSIPTAGRDRRPWVRGAHAWLTRTANASAGNDYSTTSTTMTPIDSTNLALRIECSGVPLRLSFFGDWQINSTGQALHMDFFADGASVVSSGATPFYQGDTTANEANTLVAEYMWVPAAGSHLIVPNWSVSSGTATLLARAGFPVQFLVRELVAPNANNGTT